MWVQLRLHHPDLCVIKRLLVLKQRLLVAPQRQHHPVKLLRQLSELIALPLLHWDLHLQIVPPDLRDCPMQRSDRLEHLSAQPQAQRNAHRHAAKRAQRAHRVE